MSGIDDHRDRGETTAQLVVVVPVVVMCVMIALQLAVHAHVAHVATAAAAHGAAVAATPAGTPAAGGAAARQMARELGAELAGAPAVQVSDGIVSVRVQLNVPSVIPLFPSIVGREVVEPRERVLREWQR
jgi:hypothetical protein